MDKKILQFLPYSYHIHTGGLEKIAQTLSDGFNANPHITCLNIASDIPRGYAGQVKDTKDTIFVPSFDVVYNYPIAKVRSKKFWQSFSEIKKYNPDIIQTHTRFFLQSFVGGLLAKRLGCKRVHVEHGSGFVSGYVWYIRLSAWLFDRTIGLWIFRQCDTIITISQMHKTFIQKFTSKEPVVIYNPIDYIPQQKVKNVVPHIGFVGSLIARKGVDLLIQALKHLAEKEWTCTIVGEGDQRKKLEESVDKLGLADRITFVGADDRANWLHMFDIFVNPSYQEGLPTTVVEALLAGCVVVATDVGGTREISDKQDLILCKEGNVIAISNALNIGLRTYNKVQGLSQSAVCKKFGVGNALNKYSTIYQ